MTKRAVNYIKVSATARHIMETVFSRADTDGLTLNVHTVTVVMRAAIELALIAHVPEEER